MDTIKIKKDNVLMVAHRGLSGLEPENSISAFVAAGNRSYYGAECDVHVTRDGKFVVIHDETTGRVAAKNVNVEKSSFRKVRKVKLDSICGIERKELGNDVHYNKRADLVVPELCEYIDVCKKYNIKCVLEVKNKMEPKYIKKMVKKIKKLDYLENVIFISFCFENMVELRKLLPNQSLQYLVSKCDEDLILKLNEYSLDLDIHYKALTKEIVDEVHSNGHVVNCWTVDVAEDAEKLVEMGVDMITTNILE